MFFYGNRTHYESFITNIPQTLQRDLLPKPCLLNKTKPKFQEKNNSKTNCEKNGKNFNYKSNIKSMKHKN